MAKTFSEHIQSTARAAEERFRNFVPTLERVGNIVRLNWQNQNGSRECQIVFLYDADYSVLTIHGDLGDAVYRFGRDVTFEQILNISVFEYFESKLSCATEKLEFNEEFAKAQLKEHLDYDQLEPSKRCKADKFITNFLYACGDNGFKNNSDYELINELWALDPDFEVWVYMVGLLPHVRHIYFWQALRQAGEVLVQKGTS